MKNTDKVRTAIKEKFGTISKFCRCASMDRYELQKLLTASDYKLDETRKKRLESIFILVSVTSIDDSQYLDNKVRHEVYKQIEKRGGVTIFCRKHDLSTDSVWQIMNGTRKRITPKVKELLAILDIDI